MLVQENTICHLVVRRFIGSNLHVDCWQYMMSFNPGETVPHEIEFCGINYRFKYLSVNGHRMYVAGHEPPKRIRLTKEFGRHPAGFVMWYRDTLPTDPVSYISMDGMMIPSTHCEQTEDDEE